VIASENVCSVITIAMVWRSFVRKGFKALWDNIITVAMLMVLTENFNFVYATLWKQYAEIKDCSLIHDLLATCESVRCTAVMTSI
jgi:hypothetical protein